MSATGEGLTKEEIRRRYFAHDLPIDRHGNYMEKIGSEDHGRTGFCALLHYKLIDGMSDREALEQMRNYDMSEIEARFTLQKAKDFVNDTLGIDLEEIRTGLRSTVRYIFTDVQKILSALEFRYQDARYAEIQVGDFTFQADEKSQVALSRYIQSETAPAYWLTANNTRIEPFTLEQCKTLLAAIVERDQKLHHAMSEQKSEVRAWAEARDYDSIKAFALEQGL